MRYSQIYGITARIRRGPARGFTLVEAMISLFVFGLVTVIFASSLIVGKSASTMNGQYAQAIWPVPDFMETLFWRVYNGVEVSHEVSETY